MSVSFNRVTASLTIDRPLLAFSSLTEENMLEDEPSTPPPRGPMSQNDCMSILHKVCPDHPLPTECQKFEEVKVALQRKNSNRSNHAIAFEGMHAGEAAAAMVAREHGFPHHAQIQRRLTTPGKKRLW